MTTIGYARTSTSEQAAGLAAQERDLRVAGAERIITEQISATARRPGLEACLAALCEGDVLVVTKPDRLARSTGHLLSIVDDLNKRGVGLILLSMGGERLDTRNPTAKLMLTMLAAFAEFERNLMHERQAEGVAKAKAEGRYKGGKRRVDHDAVRKAYDLVGAREAAREFNLTTGGVYKIVAAGAAPSAKTKPSPGMFPARAIFRRD